MRFLEKLSEFVGKYMAIIVVIIAAIALFQPSALIWIKTSWVTTLLMIVMFGMGLTMKPADFAVVFKRPRDIIIGFIAQFSIMPFLAFALGKLFQLDDALLVGVILVGTCPGGTSSNVMTYLSKGDVALSVGMTSVSTIFAPIVTPALTYLLLKETVNVDMMSMFISIVQVVILPIGAGFIINKFFSETTQKAVKILPLVSVTAIVMIVAAVVAANSERIMSTGLIVFAVVILHNLLGYALGYCVKNLAFTLAGIASIDKAIITSGGVDLKEINPSTMESKLVKGLYFAGEVLDVDALTGGYNLQCAFATGRSAGIAAGREK